MKITIPNEAIYARVNRWVDDSYNGVCFGDFYCLKEQSLYNIIDEIKKGTLNSNLNAPNVDFMPIAKVVISSETLIPNEGNNTIPPLNTNKNVIGTDVEGNIDGSVKLVFTKGSETWTDNIAISYQGSSSINDLKKGFSVDFEEKHRLGQWLAFDSFHLKAYYTDWLHARDLVSNLLLEQIYLSRPINVRRPFMLFNDFVANDYRISMDGGAKCHIDGFPISLYINDKYWGLYSFNIKKDRRNYYMNKNNNHHILVDVILEGIMSSAGDVKWSSCEFRNPKGLMNADGTEYDSDNPKEIEDSDVKKSWQRFVSFLYSINDDTTKAECDNYINSQEFIDNIVFSDTIYNIDVFRNNTLWACWDAKVVDGVATEGHWSPLLYDLDKSFGKVENGWPGSTNGFINDPQSDVFAQYADISCPELIKLRKIYSKEIEDRYKELRSLGIFSINNITNLFSKWTLAVGADEYEREIERWPSLPTLQYDSVGRCIDFLKSRFNFLDLKYGYLKAI